MRTALVACILAALCASSYAQSPTPNVTIRSTSRLVYVDVIVTGRDGQPVTGLTRNDFTVFEDGKPQPIRSFEAYKYDPAARTLVNAAPLGPNEYSNTPRTAAPGAINVVLLDTLNTQIDDQAQVRRNMLAFLKDMPSGQQLAVFTLNSSQLRMIQGVTGESSALIAAVDKMLASKSIALKSEQDRAEELGILNDVATISPNMALGLAQFLARVEERYTENRVKMTLQALNSIARVMAGYPGRKNLVWVSGGFPISFNPGNAFGEAYSQAADPVSNYAPMIKETASQLGAAHIAVYPVDARGLMTFMPATSLPSDQHAATAQSTAHIVTDVSVRANIDVIGAMNELADLTGGKAFYNSNDLKTSIGRSATLGATYYTLTYTPPNPKWDGSFRHIKVALARPKVSLAYRRGYYALPDNAKPDDKQLHNDIVSAMLPVTAESTAILFTATVLPPGADGKVEVRYAIAPGQLPTRDVQDRVRDLQIEFVVAAWDEKGNTTGTAGQTVRVPADSDAIANIERNGLTKTEQLIAKPGTTRLRVGVVDHNTGKIGTIDVPVKVPSTTQAG